MRGGRWLAGLLLLGMLLGLVQPVEASYIRLRVTPKTQVVERFLVVTIDLINEGDEEAFSLQATVEAEGRAVTVPLVHRMAVREEVETTVHLPVGDLVPGTYQAVVRIAYTDANSYPFSTTTVASFVRWEGAVSPVTAHVRASDLSLSGSVQVDVTNVDRRTHDVRVRVAAPREVSVRPAVTRVSLAPGARDTVRFEVESESALPGSAYVVHAILDTDAHGRHASQAASTTIHILAPAWSRHRALLALGVLAVLPLGLLAVLRLARRIRSRPAAGRRGRQGLSRSAVS